MNGLNEIYTKRSAELDIPRTMQNHKCKDLKIRFFWPLSVNDPENRVELCQGMIERFRTQKDKDKVMFSEECAIYHSYCNINVYFRSKNNPHFLKFDEGVEIPHLK